MPKRTSSKPKTAETLRNLVDLSEPTNRKELFWLKGRKRELSVYRVPTKFLYFNIENGRYADKMVQLQAEHPGIEINPREQKWKDIIWQMLKGEYPGTERDIEPFQKLRVDLRGREQLKPGVLLSDGGVLDGNRRLAALLDLAEKEKNASRYEYLDAVILAEDVGAEDRWRIEAGVQIGRDEKHPYSAINQLLKIREGLELFRKNKNPEKEISKVLYGISEEEIKDDIANMRLIDEYLAFIGKTKAYNEVGEARVIERFKEAVKNLEYARKLGSQPPDIEKLKLTQFALIRDQAMTNYQLRDLRKAMGVGKAAKGKNERALKQLLEIGTKRQELRKALSAKGIKSPLEATVSEKAEEFLTEMDAQKKSDKPLQLVNDAKAHLNQLLETLEGGRLDAGIDSSKLITLPVALAEVIKIASRCLKRSKQLQREATGTGRRK